MKPMSAKGERFKSHVKKQIVPLKNNLYINPDDPLYYEKIIQYMDRKSPEAHYNIALKYMKMNNKQKASYHFIECMRTDSPYYYKAKSELRRLQSEQTASAPNSGHISPSDRKAALIIMSVALLVSIIALLFMLFDTPIRTLLIKQLPSSVDMDVVYETTDKPFLIYIPYDTPAPEVEKLLYAKALALGSDNPKLHIQLYGLYSSSNVASAEPLPLKNQALKKKAFVLAEYHADTDSSVKIRFMDQNAAGNPQIDHLAPYIQLGANIVRTALLQYKNDHGELPDQVQELLDDFPANYLSFIPMEPITGNSGVIYSYDGTGGWVYEPSAAQIADVFRPNLPEQVPYYPIEIVVDKSEHSLYLVNGSYIASEKKVGLGRNNSTPDGEFSIDTRVLDPEGKKPGVYGKAGLAFGNFALHGTGDPSSVGENRSLGCVRLLNEDVAELFPLVPKGTLVHISEKQSNIPETYGILSHISAIQPVVLPNHKERAELYKFSWLG
ncbi:L,D-transpeptidase [Paenibacillus thermotolerans]|uniref:L,D-transpeptidase n=1 Tax=Paenibacillus thermotolerans TaxID=3027807 RepID=UPI002368D806|nr:MULTISPECIES: L,D-transpeptidase [unclassified Paenibacillus]